MQNFRYVGVTQISVGLSALYSVQPPPKPVQGVWLIHQAGGTLFMVSGQTAVGWLGAYVPFQSRLVMEGPAQFYLAAVGATATVGVMFEHTCDFTAAQGLGNDTPI